MVWVFAVLIVLAMGGVAMVAAGRGAPMEPAYDDRPDALVPGERPIGAADLRRVRFPLAFRGYRMGEVDALLSRLAAEMEQGEAAAPAPPVEPALRPDPLPEEPKEPEEPEEPQEPEDPQEPASSAPDQASAPDSEPD